MPKSDHEQKWREYERDYILPCFQWANEYGIDLRKLVRDNPGKNCVELLVRAVASTGIDAHKHSFMGIDRVWNCINCSASVTTKCDFHINDRPICNRCNAEMELTEEPSINRTGNDGDSGV